MPLCRSRLHSALPSEPVCCSGVEGLSPAQQPQAHLPSLHVVCLLLVTDDEAEEARHSPSAAGLECAFVFGHVGPMMTAVLPRTTKQNNTKSI